MRSTSIPTALGAALALITSVAVGGLVPAHLHAQGVSSATLSGTVTASTGRPIPGALVTLSSVGGGGSHETTTDGSGGYAFALVAPGSYEIRAEALGYRPVIARTLVLSGGDEARVPLSLNVAPPPVLTVDTVALGAVGASRWQAGGTRFGAADIAGLPYRDEDLSGVAALSSSLDASLGAEGLPGSLTRLVADGVPVYRAPHPRARAERTSFAAFPRSALGGVSVRENTADVEAGSSAGAYVFLDTRMGTSGGGPEIGAAWSGDPLWSSGELDVSKPSMMSFQGDASATLEVTPGVSRLFVSADALQLEAPLGPRVSEALAGTLTGLDTDLIDRFSSPSVERFQRFSSLVRFDMQRSTTSQLFLRGAAGYAKRELDGPGPLTLARDVALPEESIDYSFAGGFVTQNRPGLVLELRGGVSGSSRTFEPSGVAAPAATLVAPGARLGSAFGEAGESARLDFVLTPAVRWSVGAGTLGFGLPLRASTHRMSREGLPEFFHSDGPALVLGQGLVHTLEAPEAEWTTQEVGAFAQYDFEASPGLRVSLGARWDYERIPDSEATLNGAWLQASGLRNDDHPSTFHQFGAGASLEWDPAGDGSTRVFGTASLHHGDVDAAVLGELFSQDVGATTTYYAGSGLSWPMVDVPAGASALETVTLLGPDTRAPRSTRLGGGLVQRVGDAFSVHVGGAYRRTDFLMRRRNLNVPVLPSAVDAYGRGVFGTLVQDDAIVSATGADVRRFSAFGDVWALDPDGWSEHVAGTVGLQYAGPSASMGVAYTRSRTTDNWIGAAQGWMSGELAPGLPAAEEDWSEGTSDFDVPDRVTATASTSVSLVTVSAVYRYRSGLPFTPGYRPGVDANGDGSYRNDVAFVDAALVDPLLEDWSCLSDRIGEFAERNSCRGPAVHSVDVRLRFTLGRVMGREASLVLDGFNLIESEDGLVDDALLLVDPAGTITSSGGTVTVPVMANPGFGEVLYPSTRGRVLRVGVRIG